MDSLNAILSGRDFDEPPEIKQIKTYIMRHYGEDAEVVVRPKKVVVNVKSPSLAGALRLSTPDIQKIVGPDKKVSFRVA